MGFFSKLFGKNEESEKVSAIAGVVKILQQIYEARTPITLVFADNIDDAQYTTMILAINLEKKTFILDELAPVAGNQFMRERKPFHATSSDHGITVKFNARSSKQGKENNIDYYVVKIPESLDYQQKRESFRTSLPNNKNIAISLKNSSQKTFFGYITDMSLTGCRIRFDHNISEHFAKGDQALAAKLRFSEEAVLVDLDIRHLEYAMGKKQTIMGARFIKLEKDAQAAISKFLSAVQREQRRREAGLD